MSRGTIATLEKKNTNAQAFCIIKMIYSSRNETSPRDHGTPPQNQGARDGPTKERNLRVPLTLSPSLIVLFLSLGYLLLR